MTENPLANFDMNKLADRKTVYEAMRRWPKRWRGLSDEFKEQLTKDLGAAQDVARVKLQSENEALSAAGVIVSVAMVAARMEEQVQKDEHLEDKNARIDAGLATERTALEPVILRQAIKPKEDA